MTTLRHQFEQRGGRLALTSLTFMVVAVLITIGWLTADRFFLVEAGEGPFTPLILEQPIPVESPTVAPDGEIHFGVSICNESDAPIVAQIKTNFQRLDGFVFVPAPGLDIILQPGCIDQPVSVIAPVTLTPGDWMLAGSATVTQDSRFQVVQFFSETFTVVEQGGP